MKKLQTFIMRTSSRVSASSLSPGSSTSAVGPWMSTMALISERRKKVAWCEPRRQSRSLEMGHATTNRMTTRIQTNLKVRTIVWSHANLVRETWLVSFTHGTKNAPIASPYRLQIAWGKTLKYIKRLNKWFLTMQLGHSLSEEEHCSDWHDNRNHFAADLVHEERHRFHSSSVRQQQRHEQQMMTSHERHYATRMLLFGRSSGAFDHLQIGLVNRQQSKRQTRKDTCITLKL